MVGRKKLDKRQEVQLAKSRKAVEDFHHQRRLLIKARYELQQTLLQGAAKLGKITEDREPLPATFHKEMKKYEDANLKLLYKRPIPSASSFRRMKRVPLEYALIDRKYHVANIWPFCFESYFLRPNEDFMLGANNWGYYGATQIFNKYTSGFAGTAALIGDNVHKSNHWGWMGPRRSAAALTDKALGAPLTPIVN